MAYVITFYLGSGDRGSLRLRSLYGGYRMGASRKLRFGFHSTARRWLTAGPSAPMEGVNRYGKWVALISEDEEYPPVQRPVEDCLCLRGFVGLKGVEQEYETNTNICP